MQDTKITNCNSLSDKVEVDLNVFGALMLNWVGGHIDGTDVVTKHQCGTAKRGVQFLEKLTQPGGLGNSIGHRAILDFSAGS
jgi:hypothetical protein